jgi:hypothetical protein
VINIIILLLLPFTPVLLEIPGIVQHRNSLAVAMDNVSRMVTYLMLNALNQGLVQRGKD